MKRFLPLVCLVALIVLVFAMGWHRMLSLDMLRERRAMLVGFVMDRVMLAVGIYAALYVVAVALSLPGGAIRPVAGGFLFGDRLGEIFDRGEMVNLKSVLTPGITIALVGFAVLALIPVALKHWRRRA